MWETLKRAEIPLRVGVVIALAYLGYVYLARHSSDRRWNAGRQSTAPSAEAVEKYHDAYGGAALKIVSFYAAEGEILEDHATNLCYGVLNAKSVKIEPPVSATVYPALNRCISIAPARDTQYKFTAEGTDGSSATADLTVKVLPDTANRPRVTSLKVERHTVERGVHYVTISFAFENGQSVTIDPPVFSPLEDSAPFGKFVVTPEATTTYTLTVTDRKGHKAQKQLTVEVPKS